MYINNIDKKSIDGLIENLIKLNNQEDRYNYIETNIKNICKIVKQIENNINKKEKQNKSKQKEKIEIKYTNEEVLNIIREYHKNVEDICKAFSKKELEELYIGVYKKKPSAKYNKEMIVKILKKHVNTCERAEWFLDRIHTL